MSTLYSFLVVLGCVLYANSYPLHASCKVSWSFPSVTCKSVSDKIVGQAQTWKTKDNCAMGGERCLYEISSTTEKEIKGTHTTPVKSYVDDLTFDLQTNGDGCMVEANSRSQTWYAYLDYGTNYCNLRNLVDGAGLNATAGFKETTSDDVCTQYSSHDCDKY